MESLSSLAQLLKSRQISSLEITRAYLDRIQQYDSQIQAFITITADLALSQASWADDLFAKMDDPNNLPPLLGLPIAIKDVLALKDYRCTCGSRILSNYISPFSATTVQRLLDAGIVVLGKTNMDEFAMGSSTENSAFFTTHNPWDINRVPGGSSGGSAAAVAAQMAPAALGSDTGGSVRQPASFCGVSGLKPTYGRCSRYGLVAYGSSLDSVGIFAHDIQDLALIFQHMAGFDPRDATSINQPVIMPNFSAESNLKGKRIGVPKEYFVDGIQPDVALAVREAINHFQSLGASIQEITLPHTADALPVYYIIAPAEASANLARFDGIRYGYSKDASRLLDVFMESRGQGFGAEVKRRIMLGTYALSAGYYDAYYGQAQKVRTLIKRDFDLAFESIDMIATPVAPTTAFKIGEHSSDPLAMYLGDIFTLPANLAGLPAIAFPCGFDQNHLPIGMQLLGNSMQENTLFESAHAYQRTTDWHLRVPQLGF